MSQWAMVTLLNMLVVAAGYCDPREGAEPGEVHSCLRRRGVVRCRVLLAPAVSPASGVPLTERTQ